MPKTTRHRDHTPSKVMTIPALRRAFEHIETFVGMHLHEHPEMSEDKLVEEFRKEWKKTFYKELEHADALAYIEHAKSHIHPPHRHNVRSTRRRKHRHTGGTYVPLAGAPLDYTTRAGIYITPAGVNELSYAQVPRYVESGFWNPEPGRSYDPIPGQTRYPTHTPPGMGDNSTVALGIASAQHGGATSGIHPKARTPANPPHMSHMTRKSLGKTRRAHRRTQSGGSTILDQIRTATTQFFFRPFPSTTPPSIPQDAQTALAGRPLGQSPDPTQTKMAYQMPPTIPPQSGSFAVTPINVNLKRDLTTN